MVGAAGPGLPSRSWRMWVSTDRAKGGVKRSLPTDGGGIPLAVLAAGANRHDMRLLAATLDGVVVARPEPNEDAKQHLAMTSGYDYGGCWNEAASRGYEVHFPR